MGFVISLLALALLGFGIWKIANMIFDKNNPEEEPKEFLYTAELHRHIERIARMDQEIQTVTDMLINLDMGQAENYLNRMTVSWDWGGKNKASAEFAAWDGTATQEKLRELARVRKDELVSLLQKEIEALPIRYKQNVDKTITLPDINIVTNVDKTSNEQNENDVENVEKTKVRKLWRSIIRLVR